MRSGFRQRSVGELLVQRTGGLDRQAVCDVRPIVEAVRREGEPALRRWAEHFGEVDAGAPIVFDRETLMAALQRIDQETCERLTRVADRIRTFAEAQRAAVHDVEVPVPGGVVGSRMVPVARAGCYAPGGRYPLPSSVLMTTIPATVAGVETVWVASPRPSATTLAAAAVGGATGVVAAGGAHAIAALAYGAGSVPPADVVVGPGSVYVTAAKHLVTERVAIDMLAGPSELVVLADRTADPGLVAADLLAQAEHDPLALPVLVTTAQDVAQGVVAELESQLLDLPTAAVARAALARGGYVLAEHLDEALDICDALAPEHLELHVQQANAIRTRLRAYGALFVGSGAAEVLGDYGAGPNHVLPTGGTARSVAGLSVLTFLRAQTWLRVDSLAEAAALVDDAVWFGRVEGLEAHARAAERRRVGS